MRHLLVMARGRQKAEWLLLSNLSANIFNAIAGNLWGDKAKLMDPVHFNPFADEERRRLKAEAASDSWDDAKALAARMNRGG